MCLASSGIPALDRLLDGGYPEKSAILVEGSAGNEREMLTYGFIRSGLDQGQFCLYMTRLSPSEVIYDAKAFHLDFVTRSPFWMSPETGNRNYASNDLATISFEVKEILKEHKGGKLRIAFDGLSQLLMLHPADSVYRFLSQLLPEAKRYDAVILATVQEGMHQPEVLSATELLFDGVIAVERTESGEVKVHVKKMRGVDLLTHSTVLSSPLEAENVPSQTDKQRIAVLPFSNISPDPSDEYFADGLTEELIDRLSQVRELEVIARTSIMGYKNKEKKVSEIGKELRVGALVEGSVRKAGNTIRVTAQLIDVRTEGHVWSSRYDKELQDILAVQTDIAEKITEALKLNLVEAEISKIGKMATSNPEAYVAYLSGVYFRNKVTEEGFRRAIRYLERAVDLDPNYAEAYGLMASCYVFLGYRQFEPANQSYSKARELVEKALALDSSTAEAYVSKAFLSYFYDWNWVAFERNVKRAMELKPSLVDPRLTYLGFLVDFGRNDEAVVEARKIVSLDPLGARSHTIAGTTLGMAGKYDEAILEHNKSLEIDPNVPWSLAMLGLTYLMMGKTGDGTRELEKAVALPGGAFFKRNLGYAYAVSGRKDDALKLAAELQEARVKGFARPYDIAIVYGGLGENSKALDYLEQAYEEHSVIDFPLLNVEPAFVNLHSEPRFEALLKKLNLEAQSTLP